MRSIHPSAPRSISPAASRTASASLWLTTCLLASGLPACDDGDRSAGSPDGAVNDTADTLGDQGFARTPPEPPVLTPCPAGWRAMPAEDEWGVTTCEPWPESGRQDCSTGQAHFPGEPGCAAIGDACPDGDWPADLPSELVLHVRAGAATGGSGSLDAPFATITEALAVVPPDGTIALAKGTYIETIELPARVTLWGACAAETILAAPGADQIALRVTGTGAGLRNIQIATPGQAIDMAGAVSLEADGLLVESGGVAAVALSDGASMTATSFVLDTTRSLMETIAGVRVIGSAVTLDRAVFERMLGFHLAVADGDPVVITRTHFGRAAGYGSGGDDALSGGLFVADGATVEVRQSVFECAGRTSIVAFGEGVAVVARDLVIRHEPDDPECEPGMGLGMAYEGEGSGPSVTLERTLLTGNHAVSLGVYGGSLTARDVFVPDTGALFDDGFGAALTLDQGGRAVLERVIFQNSIGTAIAAFQGSDVTASHLVVVGTAQLACPDCDGSVEGFGIAVSGGYIDLEHFTVANSALCGLQLALGGEMDAALGLVSGNPIGVNIQTEGFDVNRISHGVIFEDNGTDLDTSLLPVPDPSDLLIGL